MQNDILYNLIKSSAVQANISSEECTMSVSYFHCNCRVKKVSKLCNVLDFYLVNFDEIEEVSGVQSTLALTY